MKREIVVQVTRTIKKTINSFTFDKKQVAEVKEDEDNSCDTKASEDTFCCNLKCKPALSSFFHQLTHPNKESKITIEPISRNTASTIDSESDTESDISQKKYDRRHTKQLKPNKEPKSICSILR